MQQTILKKGLIYSFDGAGPILADMVLRDGRVAEICNPRAEVQPHSAADCIDASDCLIVPALVDIHTHIYWGATALGVKPEAVALASGCGTFVDAGSAGAGNLRGLWEFIARPSIYDCFAYLNVSFAGIFGFSANVMVGECEDLRLLNIDECIKAAREYPQFVVGLKVRVGPLAAAKNGACALDLAIEAATELNLPVMCHVDFAPPTISDVLQKLRPGDILTHCFRPSPNAVIAEDGEVLDAVFEARRRGILFDIGHGFGSFSFDVCERMLDKNFSPDLISSDVHALSVNGPAYDLLTTVNKLIVLGLDEEAALKAASFSPAQAIGHPELGRIREGEPTRLAVLKWQEGPTTFTDAKGKQIKAKRRLVCQHLILGGKVLNTKPSVN